jgi:hypothetical protein
MWVSLRKRTRAAEDVRLAEGEERNDAREGGDVARNALLGLTPVYAEDTSADDHQADRCRRHDG